MNKLLVVTGGTKGIGRAIVEKFASHGFDVATCARDSEGLATMSEEFAQKYPESTLHTFPADLSKKEDTEGFISFVKALDHPIEVLVNNTGVFFPGQIHNEEEGVLEKSIETNVYSAYRITRGFLDSMMELGDGHIFNICSIASITAYTRGASYCISKYALLGMSKVLREEMKPHGVKVTSVIPGSTYTPTWDGVDIPEDEFMKATDLAESVYGVYSLSPNTVVEEIVMRPQKGDV